MILFFIYLYFATDFFRFQLVYSFRFEWMKEKYENCRVSAQPSLLRALSGTEVNWVCFLCAKRTKTFQAIRLRTLTDRIRIDISIFWSFNKFSFSVFERFKNIWEWMWLHLVDCECNHYILHGHFSLILWIMDKTGKYMFDHFSLEVEIVFDMIWHYSQK